MASRTRRKKTTLGISLVDVHIRFFPNATTDPTYYDPGGSVESIEHSATGKYLVTLKDSWLRLVGCQITTQLDGDSEDLYGALGDVDLAAKTLYILTKTGSSNTDSGAADDNQSVSVTLTFQESTVTQ